MKEINTKKILQHINFFDENMIIYAAGSRVEGFGNEKSDVDIYIICDFTKFSNNQKEIRDEEIFIKSADTLINNFIYENIRYDIEYWDIKKVYSIIEKVNNYSVTGDKKVPPLSKNECDFIHRLQYSMPITNHKSFNTIKQKINFVNYKKMMAIIHIENFDGYIEDLDGALQSKDFYTAYMVMKLALEEITEAYLSINGETNPNRKWLLRKLKRYNSKSTDTLFSDFKFHYNNLTLDQCNNEENIFPILEFAQSINTKTQSFIYKSKE
ncbi:hypothetical protein [Staphylococcus hominis]|uniref:hypothetical protein n=1 Tax=Staphylococcus hominis TaxID=1290 RepID=UPI00136E0C1F|nr:hypothetical protein [Staphylococcus hominis]NAM96355.1 hypothetical protein [Staphylococcus hominis]